MNPNILKLSPATDKNVFAPYSLENIQNKKKNKLHFLQTGKKKGNPFVLLIPTDDTGSKEKKLLEQLLNGFENIETILPVMTGNDNTLFPHVAFLQQDKIGNAFATADAVLFLSSHLKVSISLLVSALRYGCIPIVYNTTKIKDIVSPFDPVQEKGNGFLYNKEDVWNIFETIVKAKENYKFPYDWENLIKACMKS